LTDQVDDPGASEPDADEGGYQLAEANAVRRLQDIQILQDVWNRHQPKRSSETKTWQSISQ